MFVVRLLFGLVKGLILGGLIGFGLAAAGMATPSAWIAYPVAAVVGVLVALVAGKPIWAKDARIEVGMKAGAGALLGPGLLLAARHFLTMKIPFNVSAIPGLDSVSGSPAIGMFAVTSMALIAAVLAGFYDADNQPQPEAEAGAQAAPAKKRVDAGTGAAELEAAELEAAEAEAAQRTARK